MPQILGAASDFPEKKTKSRALEAEAASENKERVDRKPRQSFSFTTFPFQGERRSCDPIIVIMICV